MLQHKHPTQAGDYYKEAGNLRTGYHLVRTLLTGKENSPNNYKLSYEGGESSEDWTTPRHRHNFEQFRHVLSGDYIITKTETLPSGWVAYFPESAHYGPQNKTANLEMLTIQFGSASGLGYWSVKQRKKGYEDLIAKGGKFEDGAYKWADADGKKHNQDAAEAVWEQVFQRKVEYAPQRYKEVIMMNPANFGWVKDRDQAGVARKILGTFTERESRVGFIRVDKGASFKFGAEQAPELIFVKEGALKRDGESYQRLTAISREPGDAPVTFTATDPTELWYVKLPTF